MSKDTKAISSEEFKKLNTTTLPIGKSMLVLTKTPKVSVSQMALDILMASAKKVLKVTEVKSIKSLDGVDRTDTIPEFRYEFDSKAVALAKGMMGNQEYQTRLVRNGALTTGAAVLNVFVSTALDNYLEGASFLALFDECKLTSTKVEFLISNALSGTTAFDAVIGYQNDQTLTAGSFSGTSRLPGSKYYLLYPGTFNGPAHVVRGSSSLLKQRPWGQTSSDLAASVSAFTVGCLGMWNFNAGTIAPPNTTQCILYRIVSTAKFRCRT